MDKYKHVPSIINVWTINGDPMFYGNGEWRNWPNNENLT